MPNPTVCIGLGNPQRRRRVETFADGAIEVRSRSGLRAAECALMHALPQGRGGQALVSNSTEGALGVALGALNPALAVTCHFDDAWDRDAAELAAGQWSPLRPELLLAPDLPDGPWDLICLPFAREAPTDLVRERVWHAREVLRPGGLLHVSTGKPNDKVLRGIVEKAFGSATLLPSTSRRGGAGCVARCPKLPAKPQKRTFTSFGYTEGEQRIELASRPGVFSHGRVDAGTRALLGAASCEGATHILDLGCGAGLVGIVAARRQPEATVTFVDSSARAVQCATMNVEAQGLAGRCRVVLSARAHETLERTCDLVLANPPYFGNYSIAQRFLDAAASALVDGGRLVLVTKAEEWFHEAMTTRFGNVQVESIGGYVVLASVRQS